MTAIDAVPAAPWRARIVVAAELVALLVFVGTRALGYGAQVDFHMADELGVLQAGRDLLRSGAMPDIAYSPFTALLYAGVVAFDPAVPPMDVVYWITVTTAAVAAWWGMRPLLPATLALAVAAWFGSATHLLEAQCRGDMATPHVYAQNAALMFVALGAVARGRTGLGLVVLALAAVNRFEFAPWVLAASLAIAAVGRTGWTPRRRALVATLGALPLVLAFSREEVRGRSWAAFTQNYASKAVAEDLRRADPAVADAVVRRQQSLAYGNPTPRIAQDFPTAKSVPAALLENPRCFFGHVGKNLAAMPGLLAWAHGTTLLPRTAVAVLLAVLVPLAAFGWWRRRHRQRPSAMAPAVWCLVLTSPAAVLVPLFVADRGELFWPLFPTWVLLVLGGLQGWLPAAGSSPRVGPRLFTAACLVAIAIAVSGPFAGTPSRLQHRTVRELLLEMPPMPKARVLCAWTSYPQMLDRADLQALVPGYFEPAKFEAFLDPRAGDTIVLTPDLEPQVPNYRATIAVIAGSSEWQETARRGDVVVYTRRVAR